MVVGEPARSFTYDPRQPLYDQFKDAQSATEGEDELERIMRELNASTDLLDNSLSPQRSPSTYLTSHVQSNSIRAPSPPTRLGKRSANDDVPKTSHTVDHSEVLDNVFRRPSVDHRASFSSRVPAQAPKRRRGRSGVGDIAVSCKSSVQPHPNDRDRQDAAGLYPSPERASSPTHGSGLDTVKSEAVSDGYASSTFSDQGNGYAHRGDSVAELPSDSASTVRAGRIGGSYHHSVASTRVRHSPQEGFSNRGHVLRHPEMQTGEVRRIRQPSES